MNFTLSKRTQTHTTAPPGMQAPQDPDGRLWAPNGPLQWAKHPLQQDTANMNIEDRTKGTTKSVSNGI